MSLYIDFPFTDAKLGDGTMLPHQFTKWKHDVQEAFAINTLSAYLEHPDNNVYQSTVPKIRYRLQASAEALVRQTDETFLQQTIVLPQDLEPWMVESDTLVIVTDPSVYHNHLETVRRAKILDDELRKTFIDDKRKALALLSSALTTPMVKSLVTTFATHNVCEVFKEVERRCGPVNKEEAIFHTTAEWMGITRHSNEPISALLQRIDDTDPALLRIRSAQDHRREAQHLQALPAPRE